MLITCQFGVIFFFGGWADDTDTAITQLVEFCPQLLCNQPSLPHRHSTHLPDLAISDRLLFSRGRDRPFCKTPRLRKTQPRGLPALA